MNLGIKTQCEGWGPFLVRLWVWPREQASELLPLSQATTTSESEKEKTEASAQVFNAHVPWESLAWSCVSKHTTLVAQETKAKWVWMRLLCFSCSAELLPEQPNSEHSTDEGATQIPSQMWWMPSGAVCGDKYHRTQTRCDSSKRLLSGTQNEANTHSAVDLLSASSVTGRVLGSEKEMVDETTTFPGLLTS